MNDELAAQLRHGRPVRAEEILGWQYRGTSLGLPAWVEALTWKHFVKVFHRDAFGRARGWNVRCHEGWRFKIKRGVPVTFGHFDVVEEPAGLMLVYGTLVDPLVALDDRADTLLGCSRLRIAGRDLQTPSYFRLDRHRPVDHVPTYER